jgi:hypothetical protein
VPALQDGEALETPSGIGKRGGAKSSPRRVTRGLAGGAQARHRSATEVRLNRPDFVAKIYQRSIGMRWGSSAATACHTATSPLCFVGGISTVAAFSATAA